MEKKLDVGEIISETIDAIVSNLSLAMAYVFVIGGLGSAVDLLGWSSDIAFTIGSTLAGFFLLRAMLQEAGFLEPGPAKRFGAYFGLSILSSLGMLFRFLVLIIPGIVLLVRWLPAYAILLSEDATVSEALSRSWQRTRPQFWPILAAVLILFLFVCTGSVTYAASDIVPAIPMWMAIVGGNLLLALASAFFTALGVAAYKLLGGRQDELTEVFA